MTEEQEHQIHTWLMTVGHQIAQVAEPIRMMGGDHDYDGAIEIIWKGIHESTGVDPEGCMAACPNKQCPLCR